MNNHFQQEPSNDNHGDYLDDVIACDRASVAVLQHSAS